MGEAEASRRPALGSISPRVHNALSYGVALLVLPAVLLGLGAPLEGGVLLLVALWVLHFARRTAESLWVHRYSGRPVPPSDYLVEYLYYWGFATWIAFGISAADWSLPELPLLLAGGLVFLLGETGNAWAHQKLRSLRASSGQTQRSIPRGGLYEYVSCAHYFFEITSWVGFALLAQVLGAYCFLGLGAGILATYSLSRHGAYKKEFDGQQGRPLYPPGRKALVPFLL